MGDALYSGSGEGIGACTAYKLFLSQDHEARNIRFVSFVDDVPIDNTDFELHSVGVVSLLDGKGS